VRIVADHWVREAQAWLNGRYGDVAGFDRIDEDGITGWGTMYALTRALQHELGIAALSNNFGDGTSAAFTAKVGVIASTTRNANVVSILQCALWCKGYSGGSTFGIWSTEVTSSVATISTRLGLISATVVDVKLMRSLLTLDSYTLLAGGRDDIRTAQQWLNGRYSSHSTYRLVPCDGIYSRDVQFGFMLGIQYEIGISDASANGNFGPGTQAGLRAAGNVGPGNADGATKFVSLFQLALVFNGYSLQRSGTFDAVTVSRVRAFQAFMLIAVSGRADYDTWAALLVSTGNPDRPVTGVDTSSKVTAAFARQLRAEGYTVIGRYLTVPAKSLERGELDRLFDAGMSVIPIMQNFNNDPEYFTEEIGSTQGYEAAMRARQLGFKAGTIIFFPVDYDAFGTEIDTTLRRYFESVHRGLSISVTTAYRVGVYATRNVATRIFAMGLADAIWVSGMSTGYSGNLGYPMPEQWSYNQIQEIHSRNIDRNAVSAVARPAGPGDVDLPPSATQRIFDAQFDVTKMQVLAERAASTQSLVPPSGASYHALSFLMQKYYDPSSYPGEAAFHGYLPLPQNVGGAVGAANRVVRGAIDATFGSVEEVLKNFPGDGAHMAATAQGVVQQGAHAGTATIGAGDLGGWALDLATFWGRYRRLDSPRPTVTGFVAEHLGTPDDPNSFGEDDLLADADGWLIGRRMRDGEVFADAFRRVYRDLPQPTDRLRAFLRGRFGSRSAMAAAIRSAFTSTEFLEWIAIASFLLLQERPSTVELDELANAVSAVVFDKAQIR
jgi:peptidoglycan hydrolase-like protein with peptidoglycan-binding domain